MKSWPVPPALHHKYHGSGYALAAVSCGVLASFVYVEDVLPEFDPASPNGLLLAIADERLSPIVRELSALGEMFFGMLSGYEFTEL